MAQRWGRPPRYASNCTLDRSSSDQKEAKVFNNDFGNLPFANLPLVQPDLARLLQLIDHELRPHHKRALHLEVLEFFHPVMVEFAGLSLVPNNYTSSLNPRNSSWMAGVSSWRSWILRWRLTVVSMACLQSSSDFCSRLLRAECSVSVLYTRSLANQNSHWVVVKDWSNTFQFCSSFQYFCWSWSRSDSRLSRAMLITDLRVS